MESAREQEWVGNILEHDGKTGREATESKSKDRLDRLDPWGKIEWLLRLTLASWKMQTRTQKAFSSGMCRSSWAAMYDIDWL